MKRTGSTSAALTVNVAFSGDAVNGVDYATMANTVTIPAGASYRNLTIGPLADSSDEPDETAIVTVLPGTGYAVDPDASAGVVLIKDQTYGTPVVSAEATDAVAKEPTQTTDKGAAIKVSRTGSCHAALTVYCTLGGTAVNGADYSTVVVPVVLAVGQSSKTLTIAPLADGVVEGDETVVLALTANAAYQIAAGKGTATVTIQDTTALTTPVVSVVVTDADTTEPAGGVLNYGYIRFARTTRFHETLTVNCTVGGTASNGVDYAKVTVPVVFAVGEGIKDVSIRPIADGVAEGVETAIIK